MHDVLSSAVTTHPVRRLLYLQCIFAVALSILVGVLVTVQFGFALAKFGGLEYAPRVLVLSVVRSLGGAVSVAASLYALVVWTHRLELNAVRPHLLRVAPSTVGLVVFATPITIALAVTSGYLTSRWGYGVPWGAIFSSRKVLAGGDIAAAGLLLAENLALTAALTWFALPLVHRRGWSLFHKLGATSASVLALRWISELLANLTSAAQQSV